VIGFECHLTAAAGRRPLPTMQAVSGTGLTLRSSWCPRCQALPTSSSSAVPFTAVTTGPQRTRTDNAAVAVTCDVRHPTRSQSSLIWLCKQVVDWLQAWIGLPCPASRCGPWSREGIGNAVRRPRPDGTADPEQESANLSCAMIPMAGLSLGRTGTPPMPQDKAVPNR
jgi:hypothetical protein